jgi:hypothetical protein
VLLRSGLVALALALAGCTQTRPDTGANAAATLHTPPELPQDYRSRVASRLVFDYSKDATGPAEISPDTSRGVGIFGSSSTVTVRYPVKIMKPFSFDTTKDADGMRCITVTASHGLERLGSIQFKATRPKTDPASCAVNVAFELYAELIQAEEKLRACHKAGEPRCLLWSSMPEADARRLMNGSR